jgi:hypothetical protein
MRSLWEPRPHSSRLYFPLRKKVLHLFYTKGTSGTLIKKVTAMNKRTNGWMLIRTFFDKECILISWIYQLHLTSATTKCSKTSGIHTAKKKRKRKQIPYRGDEPLATVALNPPPKTIPRLQTRFSKSNSLKKKQCTHTFLLPDRRSWVSTWKKSKYSKQCLPRDHC